MNEAIAQEEQLLAEAKERIERHRKGDVTSLVQATNGKPMTNAEVALKQTRHEFLFGCNIFRWGRIPDPQREELYRERFAGIFNYATLPFYWAAYERERGKLNYDYTDRVVEWCQQQGLQLSYRAMLPDGIKALLITLVEQDGSHYYTDWLATPSEEWRTLAIPFSEFRLGSWSRDENSQLDLDQIGSIIVGMHGTTKAPEGKGSIWVAAIVFVP